METQQSGSDPNPPSSSSRIPEFMFDEDRASKQSEVALLMDEVARAQTPLLSLEREKIDASMSSPSKPKPSSKSETCVWGWFLVIFGSVFYMGFLFAAVISKTLPPFHSPILQAVQNDWYYCFLVPMTLPLLVVSVYFHWLNMKLFKHA